MKYRQLGTTDIKVSQICLGSMTWGTQNTQDEGHLQIDLALDHGVNFIDTAEMYPTNPLSPQHAGRTEEIIGNWIEKTGRRRDVVLATKVIGAGSPIVRDGLPISPDTIRTALHGSLKRLKTDYVDLYQLHWPNRGSYHFRQSWKYDPSGQDRDQTIDHMFEVLEELARHISAGSIRQIGVSNETCWGTGQFLELSRRHNLPRVVSIQNEYNLLDRKFDLDLAELSHNEKVGLLAFSPLAAGILSGKYQGNKTPAGSRRHFSANLGGRYTENVIPVVDQYMDLARAFNLDPCQLAVAFCCSRPFMTAAIIGATNLSQLSNVLTASDISLTDDVLQGITDIHRKHPNPMG